MRRRQASNAICFDCGFVLSGAQEHKVGLCELCQAERRMTEDDEPSVGLIAADAWCIQPAGELPPPLLDFSKDAAKREIFARQIEEAGKWAYQASGIGTETHFPNVFLNNLVLAMLGPKNVSTGSKHDGTNKNSGMV